MRSQFKQTDPPLKMIKESSSKYKAAIVLWYQRQSRHFLIYCSVVILLSFWPAPCQIPASLGMMIQEI